MKKFIFSSALVIVLASCSNSKNEDLQSKQNTIDSLKTASVQKEADQKIKDNQQTQHSTTTHYVNSTTTTSATPAVVPATPAKKKGWSNVAKGAVIGGVVGAGTGVAVSKDKVKGGIIGAVVGAGAGAGVGALIKKKKQ